MIKCSGAGGWSSLVDGSQNKNKPGANTKLRGSEVQENKKGHFVQKQHVRLTPNQYFLYLGLAVIRRLRLAGAGNHIEGPGTEW